MGVGDRGDIPGTGWGGLAEVGDILGTSETLLGTSRNLVGDILGTPGTFWGPFRDIRDPLGTVSPLAPPPKSSSLSAFSFRQPKRTRGGRDFCYHGNRPAGSSWQRAKAVPCSHSRPQPLSANQRLRSAAEQPMAMQEGREQRCHGDGPGRSPWQRGAGGTGERKAGKGKNKGNKGNKAGLVWGGSDWGGGGTSGGVGDSRDPLGDTGTRRGWRWGLWGI